MRHAVKFVVAATLSGLLLLMQGCSHAVAQDAAVRIEVFTSGGDPMGNQDVAVTVLDANKKVLKEISGKTDKGGVALIEGLPAAQATLSVSSGGVGRCELAVNLKNFTGTNKGKVAGSCVF